MDAATTFLGAVIANDLTTVSRVLRDQPELAATRDENGVSALLVALYHNFGDVAAVLRDSLPRLDVFEAAAFGDEDALGRALDADPEVRDAQAADGFTALHLACFFGHVEVVSLLVRSDVDVGTVASNGSNLQPLHSAVAGGGDAAEMRTMVELLLARGADPNAVQQGGWTPLMAAAKRGSRGAVEALLAAGANPAARSDDGKSARDLAAPSVADLFGG